MADPTTAAAPQTIPAAPPGSMHVSHPAPGRSGRPVGEVKSPWTVFGLCVVTFGIYYLVWYYKVNKDLAAYDASIEVNPGTALMAILFGGFTLGIATVISMLHTGSRVQQAQRLAGVEASCSGGVFLLLSFVGFGPVYLQGQLNKVWQAGR